MKGLPQNPNVLLNFRLEFPKSGLTIYFPSGISEIFCQMVSTPGSPFEVDHFSRSDRSKFWLNGSRPLYFSLTFRNHNRDWRAEIWTSFKTKNGILSKFKANLSLNLNEFFSQFSGSQRDQEKKFNQWRLTSSILRAGNGKDVCLGCLGPFLLDQFDWLLFKGMTQPFIYLTTEYLSLTGGLFCSLVEWSVIKSQQGLKRG